MNSLPLCEWRTSFAAVLFETDEGRFKSRIAEALRAIDERLHAAGVVGTIEQISIESAQRSLAAMEREPFLATRGRLEKTGSADEKSGSDGEDKANRARRGLSCSCHADVGRGRCRRDRRDFHRVYWKQYPGVSRQSVHRGLDRSKFKIVRVTRGRADILPGRPEGTPLRNLLLHEREGIGDRVAQPFL